MRRMFPLFAVMLLAMSMLAGPAAASSHKSNEKHCEGFSSAFKVESGQSGTELFFDEDGTQNPSGAFGVTIDIIDGQVYFTLTTMPAAGWTLSDVNACLKGGKGAPSLINEGVDGSHVQDISYVILYGATFVPPNGGNGGNEWCSPGFWKQPHHLQYWPDGIAPGDEWGDSGFTLLEVLNGAIHPGGANANLVADYLSEASGLSWTSRNGASCTVKP